MRAWDRAFPISDSASKSGPVGTAFRAVVRWRRGRFWEAFITSIDGKRGRRRDVGRKMRADRILVEHSCSCGKSRLSGRLRLPPRRKSEKEKTQKSCVHER